MKVNAISEISIPQLGVNDSMVLVVEWLVPDLGAVNVGDAICVLETTKATTELKAEAGGFLAHLVPAGAEVAIQAKIGLIGPSGEQLTAVKHAYAEKRPQLAGGVAGKAPNDADVVATDKARALSEKLKVNLADLKNYGIIRERDVLQYQQGRTAAAPVTLTWRPDRTPVVIYGAGKGGEVVRECLLAGETYDVVGYIDDNSELTAVESLPVFRRHDLDQLAGLGVKSVALAIASASIRLGVIQECRRKSLTSINVVHPEAWIARSVTLGVGNFIKARALIDTGCRLGDGCIIDNGVILAHHNRVGHGCHLAPGVSLGSSIDIGDGCIIGIGASIGTKLTIGAECIVGVGCAVTRDLPSGSVVEGVPGKIIGTRNAARSNSKTS